MCTGSNKGRGHNASWKCQRRSGHSVFTRKRSVDTEGSHEAQKEFNKYNKSNPDIESVSCAVRKDSGDDPDITNGILVYSKVSRIKSGIVLDGGIGVGRVTKPGLDQPVGNAAINRVPRQMILREVEEACEMYGVRRQD